MNVYIDPIQGIKGKNTNQMFRIPRNAGPITAGGWCPFASARDLSAGINPFVNRSVWVKKKLNELFHPVRFHLGKPSVKRHELHRDR